MSNQTLMAVETDDKESNVAAADEQTSARRSLSAWFSRQKRADASDIHLHMLEGSASVCFRWMA